MEQPGILHRRLFCRRPPGVHPGSAAYPTMSLRPFFGIASALPSPPTLRGSACPALEAMVVGCPVIASDRASIPEVCGSAALYASPGDEAGWLGHILRLQADPVLRRELSGMGQAQAKKFSWRKSAQLYLGLMNELDASAL